MLNILVTDKKMNIYSTPSLEHTALTKTVITLWNAKDIHVLASEFDFPDIMSEEKEKWEKIENKVTEKVSQLLLPDCLQMKLLNFIKPIGEKLLRWMQCHVYNGYIKINLPDELCWTSQGTVDNKKTAEKLIKDGSLDSSKCYILACIYCLENDIKMLWNRIPENLKNDFYIADYGEQHVLVLLWTYDLKGKLAKLDNIMMKINGGNCTPYVCAFKYAARYSYKVATEYFLQKLTPEEREQCLESIVKELADDLSNQYEDEFYFPNENFADVVCFLLSQMNEEQQKNVFKEAPVVLELFLEWPWQRLFMDVAKPLLTLVHEESNSCLIDDYDYYRILRIIILKVEEGYKDCNYRKLFGEFWQQSPINYKKYVVGRCRTGNLIPALLKLGHNENIDLIVKYATPSERELIFGNELIHLYKNHYE